MTIAALLWLTAEANLVFGDLAQAQLRAATSHDLEQEVPSPGNLAEIARFRQRSSGRCGWGQALKANRQAAVLF